MLPSVSETTRVIDRNWKRVVKHWRLIFDTDKGPNLKVLKKRIPQVLRIPQYRHFRLELPKYRMKNCPIPQYRKPQCPPLKEIVVLVLDVALN